MFSKKDVTCKGPSGNTYYLDKEFRSSDHLALRYASDSEGRDYIAKVVDLRKVSCDPDLLRRYVESAPEFEKIDNPNILKVFDKVLKDDKLIVITADHETASFADIVFREANPYEETSAREIVIAAIGACVAVKRTPSFAADPALYHNLSVANMYLKSAELLIGGWASGDVAQLLSFGGPAHLCFRPPEALTGGPVDNETALPWMIGVTFYSLLFSRPPFEPRTAKEAVELFRETGGVNLRFPSHKSVSAQARNFLARALEFDPRKRLSLSSLLDDPYFGLEKKKRPPAPFDPSFGRKQNLSQGAESLRAAGKDANTNSLPNMKPFRLSYENYEEINLVRPTGLWLPGDQDSGFGDSKMSSESNALAFSWSGASFDYRRNELVNEDETGYTYFRENNSAESLLYYIYEKNKIILLMDSMNKMREAEQRPALKEHAFDLFYVQVLTLRKASIMNAYIVEVMRNKLDLFGLPDFEELTKDSEYGHLLNGFVDLQASLKALFRKLAEDCRKVYDSQRINFKRVEEYRLSDIADQFTAVKVRLVSFYDDAKGSLSEGDRLLAIQVITLLRYINDLETYFMFEKFKTTREWVAFLNQFSAKKAPELENILLM